MNSCVPKTTQSYLLRLDMCWVVSSHRVEGLVSILKHHVIIVTGGFSIVEAGISSTYHFASHLRREIRKIAKLLDGEFWYRENGRFVFLNSISMQKVAYTWLRIRGSDIALALRYANISPGS